MSKRQKPKRKVKRWNEMDEEQPEMDLLAVQSFKEMEEFALSDKDFFAKLQALKKIAISSQTVIEYRRSIDAFQDEQRTVMENAFRRGFDSRMRFKNEWELFQKHAKSPIFMPLKANVDEMFTAFSEGYISSIQAVVYQAEAIQKTSRALVEAYSARTPMDEKIKTQFIEDAKQLGKLAERLKGIAELLGEARR